MNLNDKLNVALYYDKYDPISFFAYSWNSIGIPLKEEKIRPILEGMVICELTKREKNYTNRILSHIQKKFSEQDMESGNIDQDEIEELVVRTIPNLQKYPERLEAITAEIMKVLPEASFIKDPGGSEEGEIKGLRDTPDIEVEPVNLPKLDPIKPLKFKPEVRSAKQVTPSGFLKRAKNIDPEDRVSYKIRRRFDKRELTHSERMKKIREKMRRAREILKRK